MLANTIKVETLASELDNNLCDNDNKPNNELEVGELATINDCTKTNIDYEGSSNNRSRFTLTGSNQRPKYPMDWQSIHSQDHLNAANTSKMATVCQCCWQPTRTLKAVKLIRRLCKPVSTDDVPIECCVCLQMLTSYRNYYMYIRARCTFAPAIRSPNGAISFGVHWI